MNVGEKLFELRKAKNLSQEEVAEKLNVTRQTVSKWETNQSSPDFDKIVPLCELFEITTDELLTGKKVESTDINKEDIKENTYKSEEKIPTRQEVRIKSAEVVSTSVFIYILSVVVIMVTIPVLGMNPIIASSIFLIMIAWATARIVKHYMSVPKFEKTKEEKQEDTVLKQINAIIGTICTIIYFLVSFTTMAWHITWIIFVIDGLLCEITKLFFMLKGDKTDEK